MRGCFNRPADNAEAIVDGWLRTGDLARFDPDGYLSLREFLDEVAPGA